MGKNKSTKKARKKLLKKSPEQWGKSDIKTLLSGKVKSKCCKKYKKGERKRCSKCPCYDLLKRVA